eukprot:XP_011664061.1 PREDICTED: deleted in malignant brain tumors 1 protein-like [Strongylocentrotus purpuratus]
MLGFDGALDTPRSASFGQGSGDVLRVDCSGTDCSNVGTSTPCGHHMDAGAVCYLGGMIICTLYHPNPLQVRLVNGSNDAEGRVEVLYGGSWGTICHYWWDLRDARVVCRMLGFDGALDAPGSARFGQGSGPILLDRVNCDGTEDNLAGCGYSGNARYSCSHTSDAGVMCYSGVHPNPLQVRLVNGSNDAEGRVEVIIEGSWGTICDDWWDLRDANVVCRMLGFDKALDAPGFARFGQGSGHIIFDRVSCDGTEDNLAGCGYSGNARYSCSHTSAAAGAICYSGIHPNPLQVRLVGGSNDAEGRVEVLHHDGSWGAICDDSWDLRDARVVCRMLGFDGALDAPGSARFGEGSGDILLDDVGCEGTEDNVAGCIQRRVEVQYCGHDEDAGAICYNGAHPNPFRIRLVGGSSSAEGRVEVLYDGSWGTICDNGWDLRDARVVCRMLGFDGALDAPTSARFGQGSEDILLDFVGCDGTEENLADCAYLLIGVHYYGHGQAVGAICYSGAHPSSVGVRLVGGSNSSEGRVEIRYKGAWGTVCDNGWDLQDAKVVCRMLGFGDASTAPVSAWFGEGSDEILLSHVGCDGMEDNLADCAHLGFGVHNCQHNNDAGVTCILGVRLVGGAYEYEGRVEVLHEGSWGTVCDDLWDLDDAKVVCRQLGFDGALAALPQARFGQGSGDIFLDSVQCNGTETSLRYCKHKGIGVHDCGHKEDASVSCIHAAHLVHPNPLQVRLVGGSNDAEGRVEVLHHDGSWGAICDDSWDLRDARVVCRMLGFDGALDAPGSARFGEGSGDILLDDVGCEGTEDNVAGCIQRRVEVQYCGHDEDAGAICYNGAHPNPFRIRLVGGSSSAEGRVEVLYDGSWGTICDNGWDLRDARVVCRMLGFDGALDAPTSARFGQGSEDILLDFVGCDGTEENLADCAYLLIGVHYYGHGQAVGAICYSGAHPNSVGVRLVGGSNSSEGRVEIRYKGTWGTVCDNGWNLQDAKVVCRMLGFGDASTAPVSAWFGEGSEEILLSHVGCDGTEDNLADCAHLGFGVHNCQHNEDAGVTCLIGVRLVSGADEYEGRVEILHEGSWGTVCDDLWDLDDAKVVCRQLGFDGALAALPQARFGKGSGDIFLDGVQCNGTETNLRDCKHKGIGVHDCIHKEDASVSCMHAAHLDLTSYSNVDASRVTTRTTDDLASAANDTTVVALNLTSYSNVDASRVTTRTTDDLASAANDTTVVALNLNTPPRLPDRQVTGVLHHDYESNIAADGDDKGDLNLSQFKKKRERNINMDIDNVYETPDKDKDLDLDDYILPTRESSSDEYIDMTTVYQTPFSGER